MPRVEGGGHLTPDARCGGYSLAMDPHIRLVLGATGRKTSEERAEKETTRWKEFLEGPAAYRYVVSNGTAPFIQSTVGAV